MAILCAAEKIPIASKSILPAMKNLEDQFIIQAETSVGKKGKENVSISLANLI